MTEALATPSSPKTGAAQPPSGSATPRRLGLQLAIGAVLGFAGSSFIGPAVISWWYEPPSKDAFSCAGSVRNALSQFVKMQLICAVLGSVVVAGVVYMVRSRRKQPTTPTAPTPSQTSGG